MDGKGRSSNPRRDKNSGPDPLCEDVHRAAYNIRPISNHLVFLFFSLHLEHLSITAISDKMDVELYIYDLSKVRPCLSANSDPWIYLYFSDADTTRVLRAWYALF